MRCTNLCFIVLLTAELQVDVSRRTVVPAAEIAAQLKRQAVVTRHVVTTTAAPPPPLPKLENLATTTRLHHQTRQRRRSTDVAALTSWNVTAETAPVAVWIPTCEREEGTAPVAVWILICEREEGIAIEIATVVATVTTAAAAHGAEDDVAQCKSIICMYVFTPSSDVCLFACFHVHLKRDLSKLICIMLVDTKQLVVSRNVFIILSCT